MGMKLKKVKEEPIKYLSPEKSIILIDKVNNKKQKIQEKLQKVTERYNYLKSLIAIEKSTKNKKLIRLEAKINNCKDVKKRKQLQDRFNYLIVYYQNKTPRKIYILIFICRRMNYYQNKLAQLNEKLLLLNNGKYEVSSFTKKLIKFVKRIKLKKPVKYLSYELSLIEKERISNKKKFIEEALQVISSKYIETGRRLQEQKKHASKSEIFALSRRMSHLKIQLQRTNNDLGKLEDGKYEDLNFFGKFRKAYSLLSYRQQKMVFGILFLLPWAIGFLIFFAVPLATTIWWSINTITKATDGTLNFKFSGLSNYIAVFNKITFGGVTIYELITTSLLNILIDLPTILIFSLFMAVLLNTKFKGHQLVKAVFFIPVVYNLAVINNTLQGTYGQLFGSEIDQGFVLTNQFSKFLMQIGIGNGLVEFLIDSVNRIFTIVNKSGIQILIFIAALQSIPKHLYEAARVEGATKYEMFWKITIPMVSPIILTALVFTIVDSFASSAIMQFMTVNSQGVQMGMNRPDIYSAISIIYFLANALIITIVFIIMRKAVFYSDK